MAVYIASTLSNAPRVKDLGGKLATRGVTTTYDWPTHGYIGEPAELDKVTISELRGVVEASCVFVVMPGKTGTFFEYGVAYGLTKPIVVLLDEHTGPLEPTLRLQNVLYCQTEAEALDAVAHIDSGGAFHQAPHLIDRLKAEASQ